MKAFFYLKVLFLIAALAGVMYVIANLDATKVSGFLVSMGIEPGTKASPGLQPGSRQLVPGETRYNICPTRIHSITWADGVQVIETRKGLDLKWNAVDGKGLRELSYLEVEKWLSRHCQIIISPATYKDEGPELVATIEYIDGKKTEIDQEKSGVFRFRGESKKRFSSPDFEEALKELRVIAIPLSS